MEQLLGTLGIDWRLFIGQVVNFLLFLLILRVFAYKPLLAVMEKRQKTIQDGLDNAKKQEELVASIEEEKKRVLRDARAEAELLLKEAREKSEVMQAQMLQQAEARVSEMSSRAQADIAKEQEKARVELKKFAGELSVMIAEKILSEKIDAKREERLIQDMLKQID